MKPIICWWSGGVTSAVACKLAIDIYGLKNCRIIMIDTCNEDQDTYRFKTDCEKWYGKEIEVIHNYGPDSPYEKLEDTWYKHLSLNVANGAICSYKLKRVTREKWQKENEYSHQVFGFEFDKKEFNRALSISMNHPHSKPIFPLMMAGYDKDTCLKVIIKAGIKVPRAYLYGFHNNNCLDTGYVQGGIGYWQKMAREFPEKFNAMAEHEHRLTELKEAPVTMLKDQSNDAKKAAKKNKTANLVFLKKHPDYPENKCIDDMKAREPKPLMECNGFCGTNDLGPKNETEKELNFDVSSSTT